MIINALCEYYDILAADKESDIPLYGYEEKLFSYEIVIKENGELCSINSLKPNKDDKPKCAVMPSNTRKSSEISEFVCDNFSYLLGIDKIGGREDNGRKKFETAKNLHTSLFEAADSKEAKAIVAFFKQWNPNTILKNEKTFNFFKKDWKCDCNTENSRKADEVRCNRCKVTQKLVPPSENAVFKLIGEAKYFHECDEIRGIWLKENERRIKESLKKNGEKTGQCSITGKLESAIPRGHNRIKTAYLISFKKERTAFQSYGLKESHNSRVSAEVEFKYTTVLNRLLSSEENHIKIGNEYFVFWAYSTDNYYAQKAVSFFNTSVQETDDENIGRVERSAEVQILSTMEKSKIGTSQHLDFDPNVKFFVLGLDIPKKGRITVRKFYNGTFLEFSDRIERYENETEICGKKTKIYSLLCSTIRTSSKDINKDMNPLLGGAILRAVFTGEYYPQMLFNQAILRAKTEVAVTPEKKDEIKYRANERARAAAIKAYLIRNKKEDIKPMLNKESKNKAYVLGRVFAILEKIQQESANEKLNSTIKRSYFSSACSNPSTVFPKLIKLAQHHLNKIGSNDDKKGLGIWLDQRLSACINVLDESFPKTLTMDEQGTFILGYYHEMNYKKEDK